MTEQKLVFPDRPIGDVQSLGIEATKRAGTTLVAKPDCEYLVRKIVGGHFEFKGFEAFRIFPDKSIQPHLRWSCDWPKNTTATVLEIMQLINETPEDVTHFEFYFRPSV